MKKKIAFVQSGSFSHINASVRAQLVKNFPECELVTWDVRDLIRARPFFVARNAPGVFFAHGLRELIRRRDPVDCFIQSPGCFDFIRAELRRRVTAEAFAFTFQTQSMWDASVPGVPHFLYTDHTELAPLQEPDFDRARLPGAWWLKLERDIYHHASAVFTMSGNVRRSVIEDYGVASEKVRCVFAGSNVPVRVADFSESRFAGQNILFVGVDWERKGGPELLAAFRQILPKHPQATLTIVGCQPDQVAARNIQVLGRLPLAQLTGLYESAALFCLPTRHEPFGIAFVEAMHHGLPLLGTRLGAIPDFIEDGVNGALVPRGDVAALAAALDRLLGEPETLRQMGARSLEKARRNYAWDQVGARMASVVRENINAPAAT